MASCGVGFHPWGTIAACKTPLASQPSCLHVPGSNTPEVSMGISGHHGHPMEELIPPYKGRVLKGHQEDMSGMEGVAQAPMGANGREMPCSPWLQGCNPKIKPHKALGWEGRSAEQLSPAPDRFHLSQSCPCRRHHSRALAHRTPIGVYVFLFKPLQT